MPGADASQFTQLKKASAIQRGDTQRSDPKSVNRLTQYVPRLSSAGTSKFLPSLTDKNTTPLVPSRINTGSKQLFAQNCS